MPDTFMHSYTHNCEDALLWRVFRDVSAGFYIDVGAFDSVDDSVTKMFYDRGWSGINVEPNPPYLNKLNADRPRDVNLGYAVSDSVGSLDLVVVGDTGLSSTDADIAQTHAQSDHALSTVSVPAQTLRAIWDEYVPSGRNVHFLKIDVEGAEKAVIEGADWARHRPWVVLVEATLPNTEIPSHHDWEPLLLKADYTYAFFDGVNRYYVAAEQAHLMDAFRRPANVALDKFIPFMGVLFERNFEKERAHLTALAEDCAQMRTTCDALQAEQKTLRNRNQELMFEVLNLRMDNVDLRANRVDRAAHEALQRDHESLNARHHALHGTAADIATQISQMQTVLSKRPRPLWEAVMFRRNGRPKRLFRKIFFHTSGKPRGVFRKFILRRNGTPRSLFYLWLTSPRYQSLRSAVPVTAPVFDPMVQTPRPEPAAAVQETAAPPALSHRAQDMADRLQDALGQTS